jgi:hypothetical protein
MNLTRIIDKGTYAMNGTKLSHPCMNPGHEPGTVDNDTP